MLIFILFISRWDLLKEASLIIIDEVAMSPAKVFELLDKVLRRIYNAHQDSDPMFAGKVVLFGGDMRQLGPIASDGQTMHQLHFRNTAAFEIARKFRLQQNMRTAPDEAEFAQWLQQIGEGNTVPIHGPPVGSVFIPANMVVTDYKLETLIDETFGSHPAVTGANRAILTPFNRDCFKINSLIVNKMIEGELVQAFSEDTVLDDSSTNKLLDKGQRGDDDIEEVDRDAARRLVHQDELHDILETGMPPHVLELKERAIVTLIKNLDVKSGLVNGCRLRVLKVSRDRLHCKILSDFPNIREKTVSLPRVRFLKEISHALVMQRIQFPVRLAFACTINKSQGLTLDKVRVDYELTSDFHLIIFFFFYMFLFNLFPGGHLPPSAAE